MNRSPKQICRADSRPKSKPKNGFAFRRSALCVAILALILADPRGALAGPLDDLAAAAGIEAYPAPLRAPPFRLSGLNGETASNASFKGRVVLLSFWATWCPPCKAEFPSIERLQASFPASDFQVVAVAVSDSAESITRFLGNRPAPFPILLDADRKVTNDYRAAGIPVAYLLDRQGRLVAVKSGILTWDAPSVRALVEHLVKKGDS
ncbi:MAG: TlpA disulfide reductase family protein [Rhodospirillales bacterium]